MVTKNGKTPPEHYFAYARKRNQILRLRFHLGQYVLLSPFLLSLYDKTVNISLVAAGTFRPKKNAISRGPTAVTQTTKLVVEGYPRSANSLVAAAYILAGLDPRFIARHYHGAAQILSGIKRNIPVLVLIREPSDATTSLVAMNPYLTLRLAFEFYIRFYRSIESFHQKFVVANFQQATEKIEEVMQRVNDRFGADLPVMQSTRENVKSCFDLIDDRASQLYGGDIAFEMKKSRPSAARKPYLAYLRQELESEELAELRQRAETVYLRFCEYENV